MTLRPTTTKFRSRAFLSQNEKYIIILITIKKEQEK